MTTLAIPDLPRIHLGNAFEALVNWVKDYLGGLLDAIGNVVVGAVNGLQAFLTAPSIIVVAILFGLIGLGLYDWKRAIGLLVIAGVVAQIAALTGVPPSIFVILMFAAIGLLLRGWKFGLMALVGFAIVDAMGQWDNAMQTLAMVLVACLISVVLAVPLGILAGVSSGFGRVAEPVLDFMQTMPAFVYLIPAVSLFKIGVLPGVFATVVFAMPPGVRLAQLGIQQVDREVVEAGEAFGASPWKILTRIQFPLALPTIMAGVNQVIMLGLSIVVIAGMVGAEGLGGAVYTAVTSVQISTGFEAGLGVVVVAIYLDRLTKSLARRSAVIRAQELAAQS